MSSPVSQPTDEQLLRRNGSHRVWVTHEGGIVTERLVGPVFR